MNYGTKPRQVQMYDKTRQRVTEIVGAGELPPQITAELEKLRTFKQSAVASGLLGVANSLSNAGTGGSHGAGAKRPKLQPVNSRQVKPIEQNSSESTTGISDRSEKRVYTQQSAPQQPSLSLKLRQQAAGLGYKPGSPQWRAYVLGTEAAARRRAKGKGGAPQIRPAYLTAGK